MNHNCTYSLWSGTILYRGPPWDGDVPTPFPPWVTPDLHPAPRAHRARPGATGFAIGPSAVLPRRQIMGKQSHRKKKQHRAAAADVQRARRVVSGFREQGGWDRLFKLDNQDKVIIACIFCLAIGKLLSAFFYPEENEDDGDEGGLLGMFGLRL